jgi:hypothetical protein
MPMAAASHHVAVVRSEGGESREMSSDRDASAGSSSAQNVSPE